MPVLDSTDLDAIATRLLANPANKIATDGKGGVKISPSPWFHTVQAFVPVMFVRGDALSGTSLPDVSGKGNNATAAGGFTLGQPPMVKGDPSAYSVGLDGQAGTSITVAHNASLNVGDTFTLLFSIARTDKSAGAEGLLSKGVNGYYARLNAHKIELLKEQVSVLAATTATIQDTKKHRIAITKTPSALHIYIDGVDVVGTVTNATIADTATALHVGSDSTGSERFKGNIGEVAVLSVALTAAQVANLEVAGGNGAAQVMLLPDVHPGVTIPFVQRNARAGRWAVYENNPVNPGSGLALNAAGESNTWFKDGLYRSIYGASPDGVQARLFYATAPTKYGPWTQQGPILGETAGGEAGHAFRGSVVRDLYGEPYYDASGYIYILYASGPGTAGSALKLAKFKESDLSVVLVGTVMPAGSSWFTGQANTHCARDPATGICELWYDAYVGGPTLWDVGYATAASLGATFTDAFGGPLTTLRVGTPTRYGVLGGCFVRLTPAGYREIFYHAATSGVLPTDGYRRIGGPTIWADDPSNPILTHRTGFDQIGDLDPVRANGLDDLFYSENDNRDPAAVTSQISVATLEVSNATISDVSVTGKAAITAAIPPTRFLTVQEHAAVSGG